jgi:hypothetical protein
MNKYVHLLSFARIEDDTEDPTVVNVVLLNKYGNDAQNPEKPLRFKKPFPANQNRLFEAIDAIGKPVTLINVMAMFTKEGFDFYREDVSALGSWDDDAIAMDDPSVETQNPADMDPIIIPPAKKPEVPVNGNPANPPAPQG